MNQDRIDFILKEISGIMDARLITPDGNIVKTTYICAYDDANDISARVSFLKKETIHTGKINQQTIVSNQMEYHIEYMENTFLNTYISEENAESFECFFFVLTELIKSANLIRKRCNTFPKYTKADARTLNRDSVITSSEIL